VPPVPLLGNCLNLYDRIRSSGRLLGADVRTGIRIRVASRSERDATGVLLDEFDDLIGILCRQFVGEKELLCRIPWALCALSAILLVQVTE
jgi:hypothetical protein